MANSAGTSTFYFVRETASTTIECAHFQDNFEYSFYVFPSINNEKIQFYAAIQPNEFTDTVLVHFGIDQMDETKLCVQCIVSIVDVNGKKQHTKDFVFSCNGEEKIEYMSRKDILDFASTLLHNGTLKVLIEALVIEKGTADKAKTTKQEDESLVDQMLLESGQLSDAVLLVKGKELKVHKAILTAHSPFFKNMFSGDFKESKENRVEINDVDLEVFEELLRYIYTGKLANLKENAAVLMMVAHRYQMDSLKSICGTFLGSSLTADSFVKFFLLANMYNVEELKTQCLQFFEKHYKEIIASKEWDQITANPELLSILVKILALKF